MSTEELLRVFIGGLPRQIEAEELKRRFSKYGKICDIEIKNKSDSAGEWWKTFAYINLETTRQTFQKCCSQLNNTTWRDGKITIQLAKQDTTNKYAEERKKRMESEKAEQEIVKENVKVIPTEKKGAVPGTVLPEHENWVVTKYQRVVPVMNVRSKDKKKVLRYDPSKHCHQLKKFDNDKKKATVEETPSVSALTWSVDDAEKNRTGEDAGVVYRKRMGDFSGFSPPAKKKASKGRSAADIIAEEKEKRAKAFLEDDMEIVTSSDIIHKSVEALLPVDMAEHKSVEASLPVSDKRPVAIVEQNKIDLSRFDSDSDNDAEPDFGKWNGLARVMLPISNTSVAGIKVLDESNSNGKKDLKTNNLSSSDSSTDSSSDSESEPAVKVNNNGRKPFVGTAAFTNGSSNTTISRPSLDTSKKRQVKKQSSVTAKRARSSSSDSSSSDSSKGDKAVAPAASSSSDSNTDEEAALDKLSKQSQLSNVSTVVKATPRSAGSNEDSDSSDTLSHSESDSTRDINTSTVRKTTAANDKTNAVSANTHLATIKTPPVNTKTPTVISKSPSVSTKTPPADAKAQDTSTESTDYTEGKHAKTPGKSVEPSSTLAFLLQSAANSMNSWDLSEVLGNSTEEDGSTKLAFLLESAANIIRSAAKTNLDAQPSKASPSKKITAKSAHVTPTRKLDYAESDSSSSSSSTRRSHSENNSGSEIKVEPKAQPSNLNVNQRPIKSSSSQLSAEVEKVSSSSTESSDSDEEFTLNPAKDNTLLSVKPKTVQPTGVPLQSVDASSDSGSSSDSSRYDAKNAKSRPAVKTKAVALQQEVSTSSSDSSDDSDENATPNPAGNNIPSSVMSKTIRSPGVTFQSSDTSSDSDSSSNSSGPAAKNVKSRPVVKAKVVTPRPEVSSSSTDLSSDDSDMDKPKPTKAISTSTLTAKNTEENITIKKKPVVKISAAEKHALSNKKRLEALANKKKELQSQQQAIHQSLSNLDGQSTSKKIVFNSDSEDDVSTKEKILKTKVPALKESQKVLFEDSSGEEGDGGEEDYDKMFAMKPQFEGEKGAKLLRLQQTFHEDSRFKLTDKFLESDSEESAVGTDRKGEAGGDESSDNMASATDAGDERRRNLEILQSIVGTKNVRIDHHPTSSHPKAKKLADTPATVFRDISSMQFDPTDESHNQLLKKVLPSTEPKKSKKKKKSVVGTEPAPEVSKERFFEVAVDFKNKGTGEDTTGQGMEFGFIDNDSGEKDGGGGGMTFNFLGDSEPGEDKRDESNISDDHETLSKKYENPFNSTDGMGKFDDESEEDDEESDSEEKTSTTQSEMITGKSGLVENVPDANTVVDWFFFKPEDPRLAEGAKKFSKTIDDELLRKKWEEIRPKLVENYLLKSKRATKQLKAHKTSVIKRRFAEKSNKRRPKPAAKA